MMDAVRCALAISGLTFGAIIGVSGVLVGLTGRLLCRLGPLIERGAEWLIDVCEG